MSSCDDTECQCERRNEAYGIAMGDVLAKGYFNEDTSSPDSSDDVQEDLRTLSECEANDGDSDLIDQLVPSTSCLYGPADSPENIHAEDSVSNDGTLRIENEAVSQHFKYIEESSRVPEHSSECASICTNESSEHSDCCDMRNLCKLKRVMIDDELKREIRWHRLLTELRDHVRAVFDAALEATEVPNTAQYQCDPQRLSQLKENVVQMCKRNSQQLLLMLIVQAQEFVVELKNRIRETLHDRNLTNVAEIFLTRILDGYDAFVWTAKQVTDLVKPIEEKHLMKFNLTWEFFNKALYENHIWMSEPSMRNVTGSFTTQLTKSRKRHSYQALFERYVAFVEEMMRVAELWPETERLIVKWNDKQTAERRRTPDDLDSTDVSSSSDIAPRTLDNCQASNGKDLFQDTESENTDSTSTESERNLVSLRFTNGMSVNASTETNGLDSSPCHRPISGVGKVILRKDLNEARKGLLKNRTSTGDTLNPLQELDMALRQKTDIIQEIADDLLESMDRRPQRQMCQCIYEHMREIDETGRTWWSDSPCLCALNLRWLCGVSKTCPCLAAAPTTEAITNELSESPVSTTSTPVTSNETSKSPEGSAISLFQSTQKQTRHSTTQTPDPEAALMRISTPAVKTQPPTPPPLPPPPPPPPPPPKIATKTKTATTKPTTTTHNHSDASPDQGTCRGHSHLRGSSKDLAKGTGGNHRAHTHNNHASHACHKQAKVEHIKRVLCNDLSPGDGDCSDSGSSQEDSCSTSSSTPRDSSRHCDCCYCEVFGPGIPSVAPVSRNYNEMRERLRQLLTKKKAKKCKVPCSPPKSPAVSSIPSSTSEDRRPSTCTTRQTAPRSNTPVPVVPSVQPEQRDQRDLEALLEFIEGNQGTKRDNKKTEKKARQKQRKLEEILKKAKEEAERQKLIELQKKTPEVTITVVDPQKPVSQRLLPKRNLPEVSILPAIAPKIPVLVAPKASKKKDNKQQRLHENNEKSAAITSNGKAKTSTISVAPIKLNVFDFPVKETVATKQNSSRSDAGKSDKTASSKSSKDPPKPSSDLAEIADVKLTKKERKKLRREIKKLEEAKAKEPEQQRATQQTENQPQIVTIKRVMESNSAEPTVTITLKGQTPAEDKVLFTLVNGQTKEPGSGKSEQNQNQANSGKKKKGKGGNNNQNNGNLTQQQNAKGQTQQAANSKARTSQKANDTKVGKQQQQQQQQRQQQQPQQQQQTNNDKSKGKKVETKKNQNQQQQQQQNQQQQQQNQNQQQGTNLKSTKTKKDQKAVISTQTSTQQTNVAAKSKNAQQPQQQQKGLGKKQNKTSALQQTQAIEKPQQKQSAAVESSGKKSKVQQQEKSNQAVASKKNKNTDTAGSSKQASKGERNEKNRANGGEMASKQQRFNGDVSNNCMESNGIPLSSQLKDVTSSSKINIENLKLPPGITITKVDAPAKPLPIKAPQVAKPMAATKQTTIIAAPMSGVQSNYPGSQSGGNVIVVDTGKLKQDLLPKNGDREMSKESQQGQNGSSGKKKKKKKKKGSAGESISLNGGSTNGGNRGGNDSGKENVDEPARILHNPGSNMVTIRNPAFGPPPKIDPTPQAAIIKVSENGMVTIRSPALQQAINAGLTPPSKPDFIVKGEPSMSKSGNATMAIGNRPTLTQTNSTNHKNVNGIIPTNLAELRSRLSSDCTSLPGLANIHISKVTNGQPIPESGINLKGTSITLTKVRTPEAAATNNLTSSLEDMRQAKSAVREAIGATMNPPGSSKSKKKKKRGSGSRHGGDDWNLVESVFTPKDIDLEDGEMDDAERELEAFKRFCLQSVPPPRKEKVNLNIKDIVLKKKSSSSSAAGAAIAAN